MAAINKNFVIKNGLEVDTNLILADPQTNKVGIGTTVPQYTLHVNGGIGVTDAYVSGITTVINELRVGTGGTIFSVIAGPAGVGQSVGVGTANPAFLLDIRSSVSTGQTALYVQGDIRVTGDLNVDDISITNLNVLGVSTFVGFTTFGNNIFVAGISTFVGFTTFGNNIFVAGISTFVGFTTFQDYVFIQDGLNVTGTGATLASLNVSGVSTFVGFTTFRNNIFVAGIGTVTTLNSTSGTITNLVGTSGTITTLNSTNGTITNLVSTSGTITTFNSTTGTITNLSGTNVSYSGIGTVGSLNIASTQVISSGRQLQNIASLDATTTATIESAISNAPNTFTDLNVTGITTLANVTAGIITATTFVGSFTGTATSTTNIPNLTGAITSVNTTTSLGSFTSAQLATALTDETGSGSAVFATSPTLVTPVLGAATATSIVVGSGVTINALGINASGVVTATTFIGNVNAGVGTITTFNSINGTITNLTGTAATIGTVKIVSGIITATSGIVTYFGDGSNLIGLSGTPTLQQVLNIGNTSSTGISITGVSTLTTLNSTNGTITNLTGTSGTITTFNSTNGTITNLTGTAATITNAAGTVKIGIGTTALLVEGNARVTGILTVGSSSITLNGITDTINVGTGITINASGINVTGVITATSFSGNGSGLTGAGSTVFDDTTTNQEFFPLFTATTSGTITASGISTSKLTYNPSTGAMTAVDFNSTSDINLKENIHTVGNALEITEQLRGVSFDWKETGRSSYGVIAQELEEVLPDLVKNGEIKSVNYNGLIGVLIEAIKELKKEVEELKSYK